VTPIPVGVDIFSECICTSLGMDDMIVALVSDGVSSPKFKSPPISNDISAGVLGIGLAAGITCILLSHAGAVDPDTGVDGIGELVF
jgi:hypothetical protein